MLLNKIIVGIGLLFLLGGLPVLAFPAQEPHTEVVELGKWDLQSLTLAPSGQDKDSTFHARLMNSSRWFQFNISSTDPIELQVSIFRHDPDEKIPVFGPITRTNFNQKVSTMATGTYFIDINNNNPSSVTLYGNVVTWQSNTSYSTFYPYALLGFFMISGGTSALILGIFKKRKKPSKFKRKESKESKK